jgi:cellulose synthase/poly-beta-1,6-N-acetylglucosamine synthase-like glycosyltransferase
MEIIVVDDGSKDATSANVRKFLRELDRTPAKVYFGREGRPQRFVRRYLRSNSKHFPVRLIRQNNQGKAAAMNNAIQNYATGKLVMCLDADSRIDRNAIYNAARYFDSPEVIALASNVNILEDGTLLGLAQRFEYLISYQMKKAQTTLNIEYIIGGIGSMFRRSVLDRVQYYDSNTMTEDIDLTMKIIANNSKKEKLVYASDALTYTEAVPSFKSLIKQRYRWKYGRLQTFLKYPRMFFNPNRRYAKLLTWWILPSALLQELLYMLEPIIVGYILFITIWYHDPSTMLSALAVISSYTIINIWASEHLSRRERLRLTMIAPAMYFLLYLLSIVEYAALGKTIRNLSKLRQSIAAEHVTWTSPERQSAQA